MLLCAPSNLCTRTSLLRTEAHKLLLTSFWQWSDSTNSNIIRMYADCIVSHSAVAQESSAAANLRPHISGSKFFAHFNFCSQPNFALGTAPAVSSSNQDEDGRNLTSEEGICVPSYRASTFTSSSSTAGTNLAPCSLAVASAMRHGYTPSQYKSPPQIQDSRVACRLVPLALLEPAHS